jgi:hypothetical protein
VLYNQHSHKKLWDMCFGQNWHDSYIETICLGFLNDSKCLNILGVLDTGTVKLSLSTQVDGW